MKAPTFLNPRFALLTLFAGLLMLSIACRSSKDTQGVEVVEESATADVESTMPSEESTEVEIVPVEEEITAEMIAEGRSNEKCKPILDKFLRAKSDDYISLDNVSVEDDCLVINLTYSGGCGENKLEVIWEGAIAKSIPPQVPLQLHFTDRDDCESLQEMEYRFDLSRVRKVGVKGEVVLRISGWPERISYKYQ